jgi:hypothetical protein
LALKPLPLFLLFKEKVENWGMASRREAQFPSPCPTEARGEPRKYWGQQWPHPLVLELCGYYLETQLAFRKKTSSFKVTVTRIVFVSWFQVGR